MALGRALAARPPLIDESTSDEVLDVLLELLADNATSLLMVTHSERMASRLQRRIRLHNGRLSES